MGEFTVRPVILILPGLGSVKFFPLQSTVEGTVGPEYIVEKDTFNPIRGSHVYAERCAAWTKGDWG